MNITLHQRTADRAKIYTDDPSLPLTGKATSVPRYSEARPVGKARRWTGRIASGLAIAFLLFDAIPKILLVPWVVKATTELGFPLGAIRPIGLILLTCTVLYCVPRTAILGAVLLTGYLGGAVEANVHLGNPLWSHTLFPIYFAVVVWGGLALRDPRVWGIFASRRRTRTADRGN